MPKAVCFGVTDHTRKRGRAVLKNVEALQPFLIANSHESNAN